MNRITKFLVKSIIYIVLITLLACGGSKGGNDSLSMPTWTPGIYEDESNFKNLCENPRTGVDFYGNPYPDRRGSTLHEKHWLRAWSFDTYLWYDELPDEDPALYSSPIDYFYSLKSSALTASGKLKDKYHFWYYTDEYEQLSHAGVSVGYGVKWAVVEKETYVGIVIKFVEPDSGATAEGVNLARGAEVLEIDGINLQSAYSSTDFAILNAGLSPASIGETHIFTIRDVGASGSRTVTLQAAEVAANPVPFVYTIPTASGNVGYIFFNKHNYISEEKLVNAVTQLADDDITDLVLDLRYNSGGLLYIASQLSYMIAGETATSGKTFDEMRFNDKYPDIHPLTGSELLPWPFFNTTSPYGDLPEDQPLPVLDLTRVFILSTDSTCSASESIINGLRGIDVEVILIGDTTCGKPYGFYATDNCGITYFTIQFKGANEKGFGDYSDGFSPENKLGTVGTRVPGCSVVDDYFHELGDKEEALLAAALQYRDDSSCPSPPPAESSKSMGTRFFEKSKLSNDGLAIELPPVFNQKIYTMPWQ